MSYHIPKEDRVADAIFTVMYRNLQIRSQNELARLVRMELEKDCKDYRVSTERIRMLALKRGLALIHIDYNETDDTVLPETCLVCRSPMSSIRNMTIYGESREVGRKCTVCTYSVGMKKRIPRRYTFSKNRR